jgi:hypothetical protein
MRRTLGLLGFLLLTAGHHGGHGHHGGGSGFQGCGGSVSRDEVEVVGTVALDAHDEGRAVITMQRAHARTPITGKQVRVQGQLLVELVPGHYVGPVDGLQPGQTVEIVADDHVLQGRLPERADRLALQGSAPRVTIAFDEHGPASEIDIVTHSGDLHTTAEHSGFEEDARESFDVADLGPLSSVEVRVRSDATGVHVLDRVTLQTDAELVVH